MGEDIAIAFHLRGLPPRETETETQPESPMR